MAYGVLLLSLLTGAILAHASSFTVSPPAWVDIGQPINFTVRQGAGGVGASRTELRWQGTGSCNTGGYETSSCAAAWSNIEWPRTAYATSTADCVITHGGQASFSCGGSWPGGSATVKIRTYVISGGLNNSLDSRATSYQLSTAQTAGQDNNGTGTVLYSSETPTICSVTESGQVMNLKAGTCRARATLPNRYNREVTAQWTILPDADRDGVTDASDNCPFAGNPSQSNIDSATGDTKGDVCDEDMDGDGVLNDTDICPNVNNPAQNKSLDICWTTGDSDGDGYTNNVDTCPNTPNPGNVDADLDGKGDACDDDRDGDGKLNVGDNCPDTPNPDQADANGDGVGDACERKFVKTTGLDANDCSSWATACQTIQRGINAADSAGLKSVFIAKGIYRPATTITLKKGISLYGGFAGIAGELTPASAQPSVNKTIISGDSDFATNADTVDADGIVQTVSGIKGTNLSSSLLSAISQGVAAADKIRLSGLILNAGSNTAAARGGALTVNTSNVELVNTRVVANRSLVGGALYLLGTGSIVTIDGSTLSNNVATSTSAGAIYDIVFTPGVVTVTNSVLQGNSVPTGQYGGAIHKAPTSTSAMLISKSTFEGNKAGYAGAIYHQGGPLEIGKGTVFRANEAVSGAGGAIRAGATGSASAVLTIDKSEFENNSATSLGGAIYFGSDTTSNDAQLITSSLFTANKAQTHGGAIAAAVVNATAAKLQLINNTFHANLAGSLADGNVSASTGHGGALYVQSTNKSVVEMDYNTLVANATKSTGGQGGGIHVQAGFTPASAFKIGRTLLAGNTTPNEANGLNAYLGATVTDNGYNLLGFNGVTGVNGTGILNAPTNIKPTAAEAPTLDKIVEAEPVIDGGDGYYNINAPLPVLPIIGGGKARDAIPSASCGSVLTDARGENRPDAKASKCDIGAYEYTVLSCQEDAQRRYDQGELFIKACTPQTENFELKVGSWNILGLLLLGLVGMLHRRQVSAV